MNIQVDYHGVVKEHNGIKFEIQDTILMIFDSTGALWIAYKNWDGLIITG